MNKEYERYDQFKKENGGGRSANATTTYILSLPEDLIHPTDEQWTEIYKQTIDNFCEVINENQQRKEEIGFTGSNEKYRKNIEQYNAIRLTPETFKNNAVAVIHNEENNNEKASHIHVIASNIQDGQYLKMLNQTAGQNFIKKAYDKAVKNVLGLDPLNYVPKCDRLSKPEQEKNNLVDKKQFEARDPKNKTRKRRRRKPTKPAYIAREEQHEAKAKLQTKETDKFNKQKDNTIKRLSKINKDILTKEKEVDKKEIKAKIVIKKSEKVKSELREYIENILDDNFLTRFWESIERRAKANHLAPQALYNKELETLKGFEQQALNELEKLEPGAIKKHREELKLKQERNLERHNKNEFKTEQELKAEQEKNTLIPEKPKESFIKRARNRLNKIMFN